MSTIARQGRALIGASTELRDEGRANRSSIGAEGCHSVRERIRVSELYRLTEWVLAIACDNAS